MAFRNQRKSTHSGPPLVVEPILSASNLSAAPNPQRRNRPHPVQRNQTPWYGWIPHHPAALLPVMAGDIIQKLAEVLATGLPGPPAGVRPLLVELFGGRYHRRHFVESAIRDAYKLASDGDDEGVPFAGLIHPDNPPSGPYGGTSVVWFPTKEHGSLLSFVVGTRGLSPDEGILTRPGHRRRLVALRQHLASHGIVTWTKPDPAALGVSVPKNVRARFSGFERALQRYGSETYACALVPREPQEARVVVQAFMDLYAFERGWDVLKEWQSEYDQLLGELREGWLSSPKAEEIHELLRRRRFVILQGAPGTGKTRMAEDLRSRYFDGRGMTVQFHPAVTYEDFVVGLAPDVTSGTLHFTTRTGWLVTAAQNAKEAPFLLVIDEINRADLGRVLGEAIYLFEPGEVGGERARRIRLPHPVDGVSEFQLPSNLYVIATMNTADRSIAALDIAVRRRFAYVTMHAERSVIAAQQLNRAVSAFDRIADVFIEHAPEDALNLLPGHAYFLAKDDAELCERFRYELVPLLDEYLRQGLLGSAQSELAAVRDAIQDDVGPGRV